MFGLVGPMQHEQGSHTARGSLPPPVASDDAVLDAATKRHVHLDMVRVLAVAFVAIDHGYKQYSINNVMFTQSWVLQLLWVVCGISWSISRRPLQQYLRRIGIYFLVGVACNWVAWLLLGKDWLADPMGVVYQFWFIVGLALYVIGTAFVKPQLLRACSVVDATDVCARAGSPCCVCQRNMRVDEMSDDLRATRCGFEGPRAIGDEHRVGHVQCSEVSLDTSQDDRAVSLFTFVLASQAVAMIVAAFALSGAQTTVAQSAINLLLGEGAAFWTDGLEDRSFFGQLLATFGALFLVSVGARLLRSPRLSPWLAWILIAYAYVNRVVFLPLLFGQFGGGVARFFVGFELFLIGLTANCAGLRNVSRVRRWIGNYWFLALVANAFLWGPSWMRRMDERPPHDFLTIFRVNSCEAIWLVSFLAAGSLWFNPVAWPDETITWLRDAALFLYLFHRAVHLLVAPPMNWILLFALLPFVCWWRLRGPPCFKKGGQSASEAEQPADDREGEQTNVVGASRL